MLIYFYRKYGMYNNYCGISRRDCTILMTLSVFFFLRLATANVINSLLLPGNERLQSSSKNFDIENSSNNHRDNRPIFVPSTFGNEANNEINLVTQLNGLSPCNGTYTKKNGTTCGLKEIMIGRCYEYQYIKRGLYSSYST